MLVPPPRFGNWSTYFAWNHHSRAIADERYRRDRLAKLKTRQYLIERSYPIGAYGIARKKMPLT